MPQVRTVCHTCCSPAGPSRNQHSRLQPSLAGEATLAALLLPSTDEHKIESHEAQDQNTSAERVRRCEHTAGVSKEVCRRPEGAQEVPGGLCRYDTMLEPVERTQYGIEGEIC